MSEAMDDGLPEETPPVDAGALDMKALCQTIIGMLQTEPQRYKLFGIYWWPVKQLLKREGYTPDNLYMLGSYQDAETAAMVPHMSLDETMRAAVAEFQQNATFQHSDGKVENEDGEIVTVFDEDARF